MTEQTTTAKGRLGRSPAFPFISLPKALGRARELHSAEGRHAVPVTIAYKDWKLGVKGGAAKQTMAALRHFGLVQYEGKAQKRAAKISDLAFHIIVDRREDTAEKDALIKKSALTPAIFAELWRKWGRQLPSNASIEHFLIIEKNFKEAGARNLIPVYKDTIEFAELVETDTVPDELNDSSSDDNGGGDDDVPVRVGDFVQWEAGGVLQFEQPKRVTDVNEDEGYLRVEGSQTGILMSEVRIAERPESKADPAALPPSDPKVPAKPPAPDQASQLVQEERIYDDQGNPIVIRFTGDMGEMYDFLSAYIEFRKQRRSK